MTPSSNTESPTRSCLTSGSDRGVLKRYSAMLEPHFHLAVGPNFRAAALGSPALQVNRDGIACDMRPGRFDMHAQGSRVAAQSLRPYAALVDGSEQLLFQLRKLWVRALLADGARGGLFCQGHAQVGGPADA